MRPQPCVRSKKAHKLVTTVTPKDIRHSPRDGFTVSFVLFLVIGLFVTIPGAMQSIAAS